MNWNDLEIHEANNLMRVQFGLTNQITFGLRINFLYTESLNEKIDFPASTFHGWVIKLKRRSPSV